MTAKNIVFPVNISSKQDSNKFLRATWAQFRIEFGKCGWMFMPIRNTGRTNFGKMSLGEDYAVGISVTYQKRATIDNIIIDGIKDENLFERIKKIARIRTAKLLE
jgi:hypothetical protein